MSATQGELAALSKYIFRAPRWYASVGFALLVAALAGVAAFDSVYFLENAWQGVFYIGLPTVVASLLTTPVDRALGGQLTVKRSSLLALTCEVLVVAVLTVAGVVVVLTGVDRTFAFDALVAALALVFAVRLLVVLAVSRNSWLAVFPASIQTLTAALLLFIYSGTMRYLEIGGPITRSFLSRPERAPPELLLVTPSDFVLLGELSVLYAGAAYVLVRVIDRPWRQALGVSLLDFGRGFVGHIAEGSRELEEFFEGIGEEAVVPVTVLSLRRDEDGTPGEEKARFVLPMIHPGPMGEIGGGNLPMRVAAETEGLAFPPHATAGHDFNLVTEREVETLLDAAQRAHDRIEYATEATRSVEADVGDASVLGQGFGDDALLVTSFSPSFADDIEYPVGLSAAAEARTAGIDDVLLVDAHNCNNGLAGDHLGHVYPGSERSFDMMEACRDAAEALADAERGRPSMGVAWDATDWTPAEGIGPLGVRVAVLEVDGQTTAYVLVDGNNMAPGLRDRIVAGVDSVDAVEVMTTDTHVVNTVESVNQVGDAIDGDELLALVSELVGEALEDREPVVAGMASERATVTVFGNDRTEMLASHANALMAMGGALVGAVVLAVVAVSLLLLLFT
jgi:putative membrane protein